MAMRTITALATGAILTLLIISNSAEAAFEKRLNYQGRLTDANGVPVADGPHDMTFSIWSAESGGTSLWSEGPVSVTTKDGLFSVVLGGTSAIGLDFESAQYWMQAQVDTVIYTPRQRMTATAMAINADMLDGYHAADFAASTHSHATLTAGTGLSGTAYNGLSASEWTVSYGSTAGTAVQGNTSITITAGTGLSGGGSITLGAGGTVTLNATDGGSAQYIFKNVANSAPTTQFSATSNNDTVQFAAGGRTTVAFDSVNKRVTYSTTLAALTAGTGIILTSYDGSTARTASLDKDYTDSFYVLKAGDTMTGTLQGRQLNPTADHAYDIGTAALRYKTAYIQTVTLSQAGTATTSAVRADRSITAGTGLSGGGNLTADRTISLDTSYTDGQYVLKAGDTMSGSLTMGAGTSIYLNASSYAGAGQIQSTGIVRIADGSSAQELYAKQACASDSWADCDSNKVTNGIYAKSNIKTAAQLVSTVATGTAPLAVTSTTKVTNLNADLLDGYDSPQLGNFGNWQAHGTYTNCNTDPSYWGWNYVQGTTNCPNATSSQWYRGSFSLGSNYPMRGAGGYSLELAYPRYSPSTAGVWLRTVENGTIGSWTRIDGSEDRFDGRYVLKAGDTMTGNLNITHAGNPGLELRDTAGGTPYIDLSNDGASDYDARFILTGNDALDLTGAYLNLQSGANVYTMESGWSGWNIALKFPNTSHAALYYPTGGLLFGMHSNTNFYWANTSGPYYTMTLSNIGDLTLRSNATIQGGNVYLVDGNTRLTRGSGNALRMQTDSGYVDMGAQNSGWAHFISDRASFYFNPKITVDGNVEPYTDNARDLGANSLRWRNLYLKGSPANGALVPNIIQYKVGPGTGADSQTHEVLCDAGYAIMNFSVYHTNYADGNITLTCGYIGDLLNTGDNVWTGYSGTCDDCWHSAVCPDGYVARGFSIYASGRLDNNMRLYCTRISSGSYTSSTWLRSGGAGDNGDDDCWHSAMCPGGTYIYAMTVWATSYPDEDWGTACRAIRP